MVNCTFKLLWSDLRADLDSVPEKRKSPLLPLLLCKASVHVTSDTGQDHLRQNSMCISHMYHCIRAVWSWKHWQTDKDVSPVPFVRWLKLREQWRYLFKVMRSLKFTAPSSWFCLQRSLRPFSTDCLDLIKRLTLLKTGKHADYLCYVHENPEVLTVQRNGFWKGGMFGSLYNVGRWATLESS